MVDYHRLSHIFTPRMIEGIQRWEANLKQLDWQERQLFTLLEGYPFDTSSSAFAQADRWNDLGWACHEVGRYNEAIAFYQNALELCEEFPMVWNNKGLAHFRLCDIDTAQWAYQRAIDINPRFIKPYSNLGILYIELGHDAEEAKVWFRRALALEPNYQRAKAYLNQLEGGLGEAVWGGPCVYWRVTRPLWLGY